MLGKQWNWWGVQQQWDWTGSLSTGGHPACALANPPVGRPFVRLLKPEFPISSTPTLLFPYSSTAMWIVPRMPWRLTNKQDVKVWSSFPRQRVFLYESDATQVVLTKIYHNISNSFKLTWILNVFSLLLIWRTIHHYLFADWTFASVKFDFSL